MDLGLFTLNFGNIARYFNKKNIVLIIFLGIAGNHSSAQIYNPKPEIRDVKIKGILFDKTKIAFSIIPDFSFPMNIRYILGKYNLHSYSKLGFEGGVNIIKDIGDKFGLQTGINFNLVPLNIWFSIPSKDLNLPPSWGKTFDYNWTYFDLINFSIPIMLERLYKLNDQFVMFVSSGFTFRFAIPYMNSYFVDYYADNANQGEVFRLNMQDGNNGKPWMCLNVGIGAYKIFNCGNMLKLGLIVNYSLKNYANGSYNFNTKYGSTTGTCSINGSYIGLELAYVFNKNKKKVIH